MFEKGIEILLTGIVGKYIDKLLPDFNIRIPEKSENSIDDLKYLKLRLISIFERFGAIPYYEMENPTMNRILIDSFYNTAIKLISELSLNEEYFNYFKDNFHAKSCENVDQLIGYLKRENDYPRILDSRYYLGFRSIYLILNENIDKIDVEYIESIFNSLKPFIENFKHKEYLSIIS